MSKRKNFIFSSEKNFYDALICRNEQAYSFLYSELFPKFKHWVIINSGSDMDAEDSFQKGLLNFLINLERRRFQLQDGTRITTVVFDYCKKVWLTELKSARIRYNQNISDSIDIPDTIDIVQDLGRIDIIQMVQQSLFQLKNDCQKLLEWFYVDGVPLREIAQRLGLKEDSVKSKRYQCAEKLKGFITKTSL